VSFCWNSMLKHIQVIHCNVNSFHFQSTFQQQFNLSCSSNSGYVCMVFYRREGHVIELQQSSKCLFLSFIVSNCKDILRHAVCNHKKLIRSK
jgi:hypothetical protein